MTVLKCPNYEYIRMFSAQLIQLDFRAQSVSWFCDKDNKRSLHEVFISCRTRRESLKQTEAIVHTDTFYACVKDS